MSNMMTSMLTLLISIFLDDACPRTISYVVYISHFIRFARVSSHVYDFNNRNKKKGKRKVQGVTAKLLTDGCRFHRCLKAFFSKFYNQHYKLNDKCKFSLKTVL